MSKKVLITGGAGFIGSHLTDELISAGYRVRILDNLDKHIHGELQEVPDYLNKEAELVAGDIRDQAIVEKALKGIDIVYHLAARAGVGQSMYEIREYTDVNNVGTAVLLEGLIRNPVEKLILASSMSIYGEGLYKNDAGQLIENAGRNVKAVRQHQWEVFQDKKPLIPVPTPETKRPNLASVYALSKYDQERLCLITGRAYRIPVTALRLFNVYGPRQEYSNPYTGMLATFVSRLMQNEAPLLPEDGFQKRDFVHVHDVVSACRLALEKSESDNRVINVASGKSYTLFEMAQKLSEVMKKDISPEITANYKSGDIRHCFADISRANALLGYEPRISLESGLSSLCNWLENRFHPDLRPETKTHGLTI